MSKIEQAQQHFPGHQEFFFIFIVSADSHKLNLHLRSQLIQRIKNGQANLKDHRLSMYFEKTLLDMQMLARFLGVLIFAPSWQEFDKCNGYDNMPDVVPPDGLNQLEADADARISLLTLTKEALDGGNLTSVIPWVTELLKMSSWDNTIHRRSKTYRQILRLLRYIQEQLSFHIYNREQADKTPSCAQLVLFCLESFFGETIGLARTVSLRESHHHNESLSADDDESALGVSRSGDVDNLLDDSPLLFSTAVLFSLNPHMEELLSLVGTLSRIDHIKSNRIPGVSRKLRPVIVSRDVTTASSKSEAEFVVAATSPLVSPAPAVDYEETKIFKPGSSSSFQSKLVDTFFHQHRELKEICEFAVHQILKKMSTSIPERFVKPALEEELQLECDDAVDRAVGGALAYLRSSLEEGIHQSLALFEPPETLFKVHELAVSLAAARGYETGAPHVRNLVINDLKPIQRSLFGDQAGTKETEQSARKKEDQQERAESENLVAQMTLASNALVVSIKSQLTNNGEIDRVLDNIRSFEVLLDKWSDSKQSKIPAEHFLRDYFESVTKLDFCSVSVLEFCTATATSGNVYSEKSWLLLVAFLKLGFKLSRHPRRGTSRVVKYLRNPNALQSLIQTGLEHGSSKYDTLAELLVDMLEDSFLSVEQLENALVCKMDETAEVLDLAKLCLAQLQRRETLVFEMPRLKSKVVSISEK